MTNMSIQNQSKLGKYYTRKIKIYTSKKNYTYP